MPVHDWKRVPAGVFHDFHNEWIGALKHVLNGGLLPGGYYALAEQFAGELNADVLTLKWPNHADRGPTSEDASHVPNTSGGASLLLAPPKLQPTAESEMAFYRRKQKTLTVRHASGDRVVAVIEIVSPGNKDGRKPLRTFVDKAVWLLEQEVHLLIIDLLPPGRRDPNGIHGEIWQEMEGKDYELPAIKPLTLAAYEAGAAIRAYVVHVGLGDELPDMPLFLAPRQAIDAPLEATYRAAFAQVPPRWRREVEA